VLALLKFLGKDKTMISGESLGGWVRMLSKPVQPSLLIGLGIASAAGEGRPRRSDLPQLPWGTPPGN
jgi:hypothetical protein